MDLSLIREKIDQIDSQIVELFEARMKISKEVAEFKITIGKPVFDKQREAEKLECVTGMTHNEFNAQGIEELFEQIMSISRKLQYQMIEENSSAKAKRFQAIDQLHLENVKVVFQGAEGAYSHAAMKAYFSENIRSSHVDSFKEAVEQVDQGAVDYAVVPLENSTAGAVADIYDLMAEFDVCIVGEQVIDIEHCLLGLEGTDLSKVERVYSHPQSLMQSKLFLEEMKWKQISMDNNAFAAQKIAKDQDKSQVAIASALAGKLNGLHILKKGVNSVKTNATRFIIITKDKIYRKEAHKVSICFELANESGSLYRMLSHFIFNKLNLTKIESRPILNETWGYRFFLDVEGNLSDSGMRNALQGLEAEAKNLKILGNY